jgi:hypothetical protein
LCSAFLGNFTWGGGGKQKNFFKTAKISDVKFYPKVQDGEISIMTSYVSTNCRKLENNRKNVAQKTSVNQKVGKNMADYP